MEINEAISPYSIAVAPFSSHHSCQNTFETDIIDILFRQKIDVTNINKILDKSIELFRVKDLSIF
jgi:hypothetical protein